MGLKLNTASSGSVTLEPANTASNYTLTVPAQTGTVVATDASGNVGLGVTPSAWSSYKAIDIASVGAIASVSGQMSVFNNAYWNGSNMIYKTSNYAAYYNQNAGTHAWYNAPSGTAGNAITFTQAMTLDTSGNVGIGTSSPTGAVNPNARVLNIYSSNTTTNPPELRLSGNAGSSISIAGGASASYVWEYYNVPMTFGTNNTERMRIDSSGKVLIRLTGGIAGDTAPLQVDGGSVTACALKGGTNNYFMAFYGAYSNALIGSITGSTGSSTAYNTSSDYRLKENIAPMTGALATVAQLKPVTYTWKSTGEESQGFIAHELQAVVPDCVTGEKDAVDAEGNPVYQGIDTSFLVATLTAAIQEQQAIITSQASAITALEARLTALENK